MLHRIILTTFGLLTLATCNNQKITSEKETGKSKETQTKTVSTTKPTSNEKTSVTPTPTKAQPKMSDGLPPDKAAVEQAKKEAAQAAANSTKSGIVYLKEGENKFLEQYQMNVTFKQMSEDSRCPKDVNCIWAGVATADVEFMGLATRPVTLKISTMNDANKGYAKTQSFNNYNITLVSVTPETTSDKGFKALKGSYKIGLKFERGNLGDGTTTR